MRFLDGEPVTDEYLEKVEEIIDEICDIQEIIPEWELEAHARKTRR